MGVDVKHMYDDVEVDRYIDFLVETDGHVKADGYTDLLVGSDAVSGVDCGFGC